MPEKNGRATDPSRPALGVAAIMLLLSAAFAPTQAETARASHWKGQEVFREKGCSLCHSVYGSGGDEGPDLGEEKFFGTYLELASRMWNHFPKMYKRMQETDVEFQKMSEEEMGDLITYLTFIRFIGEAGRSYRGQELLQKTCMKCHRFGDRGADIGPDFVSDDRYMSSVDMVEAMWNHGPDMMKVFEEEHVKRPVFKGNDVADILSAIRSYSTGARIPVGTYTVGDAAMGERLFQEKGCPHCHAIHGVGGTVGPDFGDIEFDYSATQIAGRMWNHGPKMWEIMEEENLAFPEFEEGEMSHVIAYLYSLQLQDPPGDRHRGEQIVRDKGCLKCHSVRGTGGDVSVDLAELEPVDSPMTIIAAMWNHAPGMREKQVEKDVKWPKLKPDDMAHLYAYLRTITNGTDEDR